MELELAKNEKYTKLQDLFKQNSNPIERNKQINLSYWQYKAEILKHGQNNARLFYHVKT